VEQLVFVDPNIAFPIDFPEGIKVELQGGNGDCQNIASPNVESYFKEYYSLVEPRIGNGCAGNIAAGFRIPVGSDPIQ
jgi:hypothetical protein